MGVSRSSLREALRALAMVGVVEMRHGDGTYLTSLETEHAAAAGVARAVALATARWRSCSRRASSSSPAWRRSRRTEFLMRRPPNCVRALTTSAAALDDAEAFMWADIELHALIAKAAENAVLRRLLDSIASMGIASRRRTGRLAAVREQSARDHREIAAAIAAHDAEAAHAAMLRHLENVERAVTWMIERPGKIVAIGLNYMDHAKESGTEPPKRPLVFAKFPTVGDQPRGADPDPAQADRARGLGGRAGRDHRPRGDPRVREGRALLRARLHGRQRRLGARPAVRRRAVGAREEPGHVLPARPEGGRARRPAEPEARHARQRRDDAGLQHRRR